MAAYWVIKRWSDEVGDNLKKHWSFIHSSLLPTVCSEYIDGSTKLKVVLDDLALEEREAEADVGEAPREAGQLHHHHLTIAWIS